MKRNQKLVRTLVLGCMSSFVLASSANADEPLPLAKITESVSAPINELFAHQWVRLNESGGIQATVVQLSADGKQSVNGLPVSLVQNSKVVYQSFSDENGNIAFENVVPGSYSVVTKTNQSIAAFSLQVMPVSESHLPSNLEVRVVRPAGTKVKEILRSQMLPNLQRPDEVASPSTDPLGAARTSARSHVVKLDAKGRMIGQLGAPMGSHDWSDMVVYVLQDGVQVARSAVDASGKFSVEGLTSGVYGFVAAGNSGFAATAFHLVDPRVAVANSDGARFVSGLLHDACGCMNVEVVQCCEVVACEVETQIVENCPPEEVVVDQCGVAPACGCAGGGGYGGGGGGGGGMGGGLWGLAALGGLIGVAIAASDNNNDQTPQVVTPI